MTALLFPGQGTQRPGMGRALFTRYPEAAAVLAEASTATGLDMAKLLGRGPAARLRGTEMAQPAVTTVNLAALAVLQAHGVRYDAVAGHSVGVLAALAAADVLSRAQVLWLAARRGALMGALPAGGAMVSVAGLHPDAVGVVLRDVPGEAVVGLVNAAHVVVVSGAETPVAEAVRRLRAAGAVSVSTLPVSHAFHSPRMSPAVPAWADTVATLPLRRARVPLLADTTGEVVFRRRDLRDYLVGQLTAAVRWDLVLDRLTGLGVDTAIEAGDSRTLRALGRGRTGPRIRSMAVPQELAGLLRAEPHPTLAAVNGGAGR